MLTPFARAIAFTAWEAPVRCIPTSEEWKELYTATKEGNVVMMAAWFKGFPGFLRRSFRAVGVVL